MKKTSFITLSIALIFTTNLFSISLPSPLAKAKTKAKQTLNDLGGVLQETAQKIKGKVKCATNAPQLTEADKVICKYIVCNNALLKVANNISGLNKFKREIGETCQCTCTNSNNRVILQQWADLKVKS